MKTEKFLYDIVYIEEKRKYIDAINKQSTAGGNRPAR